MVELEEKIVELTNREQFLEAFPIINQLRTHLNEESYFELLTKMQQQGYRLFAIYAGQHIRAVAGLGYRVNFYNEEHIFIYDLVTDSNHRSKGYGEKLLAYIHEWAEKEGVSYVALESGIQRTDAHRFYENIFGYDKWCYSFRKQINTVKK